MPLQSTHQLMKWEMHQPCKAPTPAQALGLTPLPDPSSPADALEASMTLRSSGECAGAQWPFPPHEQRLTLSLPVHNWPST